ncbi:hypothetical protein BDQ17DRAFT_1422363 [Cyathus striatus]|nr:hypothetical protein BDQ17DRAFT_1422363 [Cyathus striatus]
MPPASCCHLPSIHHLSLPLHSPVIHHHVPSIRYHSLACLRKADVNALAKAQDKAYIKGVAMTNETSSEGTDLHKELTKFFPALTKDKFGEIDLAKWNNDFPHFHISQSAFSEEVIVYLSSFIRVRDPNRYKLARSPTWPAYVTRTSDNHHKPKEGEEQVVFDGHEKERRRTRLVLRKSDDTVVDVSAIGIEEVGGREVERCLVVAAAVDDLQN